MAGTPLSIQLAPIEGYTIRSMNCPTKRCHSMLSTFPLSRGTLRPLMIRKECLGVHEMTYLSINQSDIDFRKILYNKIVLSGGNTIFRGFQERLGKEKANDVIAPKKHNLSAWIGGSILSSLSTFQTIWISKE